MIERATILDATTRQPITGNLIKHYPLGLTIDDARGIRHYATFDRVIEQRKSTNDLKELF